LVLREPEVTEDPPAQEAPLVPKVQREKSGRQDYPVLPDLPVLWERQAYRVPLVSRASKETLDLLEDEVQLETLDPMAPQVQLGLPDQREHREQQVIA
jgi:hypothetical protein